MKIKQIIILIVICTFYSSAWTQNDLVTLKNGSAIRGKILAETTESVQIKTKDGSIWNYAQAEIESIGKYKPMVPQLGYYNQTSISLLGGSDLSASFQVINGYSFNPHWGLGIGLGIESFRGRTYAPIFIDGQYTLNDNTFSPFGALSFGYDIATQNAEYNKGGLFGNARIGMRGQLGEHIGILTSIGYRYAYLRQDLWHWWDTEPVLEITRINRFEFRFGFIFR